MTDSDLFPLTGGRRWASHWNSSAVVLHHTAAPPQRDTVGWLIEAFEQSPYAHAIRRDARLNPQERYARNTELLHLRFRDAAISAARAVERDMAIYRQVLATLTPEVRRMLEEAQPDQVDYDPDPEACWRCDARRSCSDVGLCDPCHADLVGADR